MKSLPVSALCTAAGIAVFGIDFFGKTGENLFWGILELTCGMAGGFGLAALWLRDCRSWQEKVLAGLLLCCHILEFWMWIPFAIGIFCKDRKNPVPDRQWVFRVLFTTLALGCGTGGFGLFYWGWSAPQPEIPLWQTLGGLTAAIAVPGFAAWYFLHFSPLAAWQVAGRFTALYAGVLFLCHMGKLPYRRPEAWYIYAAMLLICGGAAFIGWRKKLPAESRKILLGSWGMVLWLTATYMVLDCYLDRKYYGYHFYQEKNLARVEAASRPVLEACRRYRDRYGIWPEDPEQMKEWLEKDQEWARDLLITGCYTDEKGDFRILMKRHKRIHVLAYCFKADGSGKWEIIAPYHPRLKPGDRRWKHRFPYTD